jgi:hypothetical protein
LIIEQPPYEHRTVFRRSGRSKREPHKRRSETPIGCTRTKCGAGGACRKARREDHVSGGHAPRKYRPCSSCSHRSSRLPGKTTRRPPPGSAPRDPLHGQFAGIVVVADEQQRLSVLFLNTSLFHTWNASIETWRCLRLRAWEGAAIGQSTGSRLFDARMPCEEARRKNLKLLSGDGRSVKRMADSSRTSRKARNLHNSRNRHHNHPRRRGAGDRAATPSSTLFSFTWKARFCWLFLSLDCGCDGAGDRTGSPSSTLFSITWNALPRSFCWLRPSPDCCCGWRP